MEMIGRLNALALDNENLEQSSIKLENSQIHMETITGQCQEIGYRMQIFHLQDSYYIWIGHQNPPHRMSNLYVAMPTRFEALPIVSHLVGVKSLETEQLAQRVSKLVNAPVYVSGSLSGDTSLWLTVERHLRQKLSAP